MANCFSLKRPFITTPPCPWAGQRIWRKSHFTMDWFLGAGQRRGRRCEDLLGFFQQRHFRWARPPPYGWLGPGVALCCIFPGGSIITFAGEEGGTTQVTVRAL